MGRTIAKASKLAGVLIFVAGLVGAATATAVAQASASGAVVAFTRDAAKSRGAAGLLMRHAVREGRIRVIAGLDTRLRPDNELTAAEQQRQARALNAMAGEMVARVIGRATGDAEVTNLEFIPFVVMTVTPAQLSRLLADPGVISVEEDFELEPLGVGYNATITETDKVWAKGFDGTGYVVAVMDSGVDATHPMLTGKLVSEACYSKGGKHTTSLCPGGAASSTAAGSGSNCPAAIKGCNHGTGVASIAIGGAATTTGIASGAKLISIKAGSKFTTGCKGDSPCVRFLDADAIKGLKRVYALRKTFKIAAVNYSVGSGLFTGPCDDQSPAFLAAIDALKQVNIATTISAGNDGSTSQIAFPACLSNAVAVASSDNQDKLSGFSDFSTQVAMIAPGSAIELAGLNHDYKTANGTSFAAPAVAGAYAALRQFRPHAAVDLLTNALKCGGQPISVDGVSRNRFDLLDSYNILKHPPNKEQKFVFSNAQAANYWTPFLGTWGLINGTYALTERNTGNEENGLWLQACVGDAEITSVMTRVNKDQSTAWSTGILVDGTIDQKSKVVSGYQFMFNIVDMSDPPGEDIVQIWRLDNYNLSDDTGGQTQLCFKWVDSVKHGKNTIKAVSKQGLLQFYVNGSLVCSVSDSTYTSGNVMVFAEMPSPPNGTKQSFSVSSVDIVPIVPPASPMGATRKPDGLIYSER
jgi:subtilisin family serine protease